MNLCMPEPPRRASVSLHRDPGTPHSGSVCTRLGAPGTCGRAPRAGVAGVGAGRGGLSWITPRPAALTGRKTCGGGHWRHGFPLETLRGGRDSLAQERL